MSFFGLELSSHRRFPQLAHFQVGYKLLKTPTSKGVSNKTSNVKCKRAGSITTPEKGKILRHYQSLGGDCVRLCVRG